MQNYSSYIYKSEIIKRTTKSNLSKTIINADLGNDQWFWMAATTLMTQGTAYIDAIDSNLNWDSQMPSINYIQENVLATSSYEKF